MGAVDSRVSRLIFPLWYPFTAGSSDLNSSLPSTSWRLFALHVLQDVGNFSYSLWCKKFRKALRIYNLLDYWQSHSKTQFNETLSLQSSAIVLEDVLAEAKSLLRACLAGLVRMLHLAIAGVQASADGVPNDMYRRAQSHRMANVIGSDLVECTGFSLADD